jgi:hypothetical protein
LLLPSAWVAWVSRDMPQLGWPHDDGIYFASAKAIASGEGYTIPFLPGSPAQTKYPPLFSWLLVPIWWVSPEFPQNLQLATLFAWLMLPPLLWLSWRLFRALGLPDWACWAGVAILALHPYVVLFSRTLRSEMPFTILLLGSLLVASRGPALAGVLGGLAYLARTAGMPLILAVPLFYAWKRDWHRARSFAAGMLPFLVGWSIWQRAHKPGGNDPFILYYLDYVWYEFYNVSLQNLPKVIYKNLDGILSGIAAPVLPMIGSEFDMLLARVIAIGIGIGVYRLAVEREEVRPYAIYALLSTLMLTVWHVPPNGRFLFPLFPLLLAGFYVLARQTARLVRDAYNDPKQRTSAVVIGGLLVCIGTYMAWNTAVIATEVAWSNTQAEGAMTRDMMACASRIDKELPVGAQVLSDNDPLLYLQTGRTSMRHVVPAKHWYSDGSAGMLREALAFRQVAKAHGMRYFLMHRNYDRDTAGHASQFNAAVDHDPSLQPLFECGGAAVFEIR